MSLRARLSPVLAISVLLASALMAAPHSADAPPDRFQHAKHARMFPLCTSCHAGVVEPGQPVFPAVASCVSCHDNVVKPRVEWEPRVGPRPGNLRFAHDVHAKVAAAKTPADSALNRTCSACHTEAGAPRMEVKHAVVGQCLDCHGVKEPHVDAASTACATCHVPLASAPGLTRNDIAAFPTPRSHAAPDFVLAGHGREAQSQAGAPIAASCATCHARNLCISCHVNAPESPVIAALALDDRVPRYAAEPAIPPSHMAAGFLRTHGREAERSTATCATCHTRESCTSCHIATPPRSVAALASAGAGRAAGARVSRAAPATHTRNFRERHGAEANARPATCASCHARESCTSCHVGGSVRAIETMSAAAPGRLTSAQWTRVPPSSHTREFTERHGAEANARPRTCETCHQRSSCLECHRPEGARQNRYHPQNFLTRHPSSAYSREANCSDCHNPAQFCQDCHKQSGLVAKATLGRSGYHDAFRGFSLGHGQAARQSLETCASCHAERDCTACHSSVAGGFRFSPHGPGFNAERMRAKNPSTCIACHGRAIPGVP